MAEEEGSAATVTKIVFPTATVAPTAKVVAEPLSLAMPRLVGVIGARSLKVMALPGKVLPAWSAAVACTVYVLSLWDDQVGRVPAPLVHVAAVLPVVALWVVTRLVTPACQAEPVQ